MQTSKCAVKKPRKSRVIRWTREAARLRRATRARKQIKALGANRLVVHRTPRHIYAQLIAPNGSEVLAAASTVEKAVRDQLKTTGNVDAAKVVGKIIAERAVEKGRYQRHFRS